MSGGGGAKAPKAKITQEQQQAALMALDRWNFSQQHLKPLEDAYIKKVQQMPSEDRYGIARSSALGEGMGALAQGLQGLDAGLSQMGINPNSGRWLSAQTQVAGQTAARAGLQAGSNQLAHTGQYLQGLQNLINIGEQKAQSAMAGYQQQGAESFQASMDKAQRQYGKRNANLQLLGTALGAAGSYGLMGGFNKQTTPDPAAAQSNPNGPSAISPLQLGEHGSIGNPGTAWYRP